MAKTILVVDDSSSMRQAVSIALRRGGYDVVDAVDGVDALTKLDGRKLHLVISDVNMPRLDGIGLLTQIRTMPAYKFTPVILLSTESAEAKRQEGRLAGAKAWVVKPFLPEQLLGAVAKLILP